MLTSIEILDLRLPGHKTLVERDLKAPIPHPLILRSLDRIRFQTNLHETYDSSTFLRNLIQTSQRYPTPNIPKLTLKLEINHAIFYPSICDDPIPEGEQDPYHDVRLSEITFLKKNVEDMLSQTNIDCLELEFTCRYSPLDADDSGTRREYECRKCDHIFCLGKGNQEASVRWENLELKRCEGVCRKKRMDHMDRSE